MIGRITSLWHVINALISSTLKRYKNRQKLLRRSAAARFDMSHLINVTGPLAGYINSIAIIVTIASSKPSSVNQSRSARCWENISVYVQANTSVPLSRQSRFDVLSSVKTMQIKTQHGIRGTKKTMAWVSVWKSLLIIGHSGWTKYIFQHRLKIMI